MHFRPFSNGNFLMDISLQLFIRFTSFNFSLAALYVLYHLTPITGPQTHYKFCSAYKIYVALHQSLCPMGGQIREFSM